MTQPSFVTQVITPTFSYTTSDLINSIKPFNQFKGNAIAHSDIGTMHHSSLQIFTCSDILQIICTCRSSIKCWITIIGQLEVIETNPVT